MDVVRDADGAARISLTYEEVRELLAAFALSMAAYGILQNFMTLQQKSWALPSIAFISRLGTLLAADERWEEPDQSADEPDQSAGE